LYSQSEIEGIGSMGQMVVGEGDITKFEVDAIVNAANASLLGGGGVDGAIHRAAGPELLAACEKLNGCATGDAKATPGFRLPAKWVFHAVGPVWHGGGRGEDELLASCYRRCMELAREHKATSVAFPAISTGVYRYPTESAARIAVRTVADHLEHSWSFRCALRLLQSRDSRDLYPPFVPAFAQVELGQTLHAPTQSLSPQSSSGPDIRAGCRGVLSIERY
jgi:O-acetyl-ADP-ribose deacetylase (regulator of RNase III)